MERDKLLEEAAKLFLAEGYAGLSLLQRRMKLGYRRSVNILNQLEALQIIEPFNGVSPREVMANNLDEIQMLLSKEV